MSEKKILMTQEGLESLEKELELFKTEKRAAVAERLKVAISYGDISENSEYDDAKNEQAFIEGHILELENQIKNAEVVKGSSKDSVNVNSIVVLEDVELGTTEEYKIVGRNEVDPFNNKISLESPVGEAIKNQKAGKTVKVKTPAGELVYRIVEIKKPPKVTKKKAKE